MCNYTYIHTHTYSLNLKSYITKWKKFQTFSSKKQVKSTKYTSIIKLRAQTKSLIKNQKNKTNLIELQDQTAGFPPWDYSHKISNSIRSRYSELPYPLNFWWVDYNLNNWFNEYKLLHSSPKPKVVIKDIQDPVKI